MTKPAHAFKGFASSYNIEILHSFNPALQFKDAETANLKQATRFTGSIKFVKTVLVLKKIKICI